MKSESDQIFIKVCFQLNTLVKAKVRRVKILAKLKEWECVLKCCLDLLIYNNSSLNITVDTSIIPQYYYHSLVKYVIVGHRFTGILVGKSFVQ